MNRDEDHLRLLSIFHYVIAGLIAFTTALTFIYLGIGFLLVASADTLTKPGEPSPAVFGWFFVAFGAVGIVFGTVMATLVFLAGRFLSQHRHRVFCLVVAALLCLQFPLGTVLGVFTIVVLMRDSVRQLFETGAFLPPSGYYVPDDGRVAT